MSFKPITSVTNDPDGYIEDLRAEVVVNRTLIAVGAFFALINIPLLFVFLTYKNFRSRFQILIVLTIANFVNCVSIMWTGVQKSELLLDVIETRMMPIRSPWECAFEAWLLLREIGDLWAPIIQIVMGIERILAVFRPAAYNQYYTLRSNASIAFSVLFVIATISSALGVASTKQNLKVPYYCGRKSSFGAPYGTFIYIINVFSYTFGFVLNLISYLKVRTFVSKSEKNKNIARLQYYLVISALSTILVSVPNFMNLISVFFERFPDAISNTVIWLTAFNSGINFFVFLALNEEFRERCMIMVGIRKKKNISMAQRTVMGQQSSVIKVSKATIDQSSRQ